MTMPAFRLEFIVISFAGHKDLLWFGIVTIRSV